MEASKEAVLLQETCDQFINHLRQLLKAVPKVIAHDTCVLLNGEIECLRMNYDDFSTDRNDPWVKKIQEVALRLLGRELDEGDTITVLDGLADQEPCAEDLESEIEDMITGWFMEDDYDEEDDE